MRIGELSAQTSTTVPTIRYYEEIGLISEAHRQSGHQRIYGPDDVERLQFIRRCRKFGFSTDQVRSLAALGRDSSRSCRELREIAAGHLDLVRQKVEELNALATSLQAFVDRCDDSCAGGAGPDCTILGDLSRSAAKTSP